MIILVETPSSSPSSKNSCSLAPVYRNPVLSSVSILNHKDFVVPRSIIFMTEEHNNPTASSTSSGWKPAPDSFIFGSFRSQSLKGSEEGKETSTHSISTSASFLINGIYTRKSKLGSDYLKLSKKGEDCFAISDPSSSCNLKIEEGMDETGTLCSDRDAQEGSSVVNLHHLKVLSGPVSRKAFLHIDVQFKNHLKVPSRVPSILAIVKFDSDLANQVRRMALLQIDVQFKNSGSDEI